MKKIGILFFKSVAGIVLVNAIWFVAAELLQLQALVSPLKVYASFPTVLENGLSKHLWASLVRLLWGVGTALFVGFIVALFMVKENHTSKILDALIYFSYPIPKLALLPVVMLLAGLGDLTKVIMIFLILVFQITINLRDGLKRIPEESFLIARSLGSSRWQTFKHVLFPAVLPELLSTLRVAIGTAISVLFVTETYGTDRGMGYFIVDAWMRINYTEMYAGIVAISVLGFILFILTDLLENIFCKWKFVTY